MKGREGREGEERAGEGKKKRNSLSLTKPLDQGFSALVLLTFGTQSFFGWGLPYTLYDVYLAASRPLPTRLQ